MAVVKAVAVANSHDTKQGDKQSNHVQSQKFDFWDVFWEAVRAASQNPGKETSIKYFIFAFETERWCSSMDCRMHGNIIAPWGILRSG